MFLFWFVLSFPPRSIFVFCLHWLLLHQLYFGGNEVVSRWKTSSESGSIWKEEWKLDFYLMGVAGCSIHMDKFMGFMKRECCHRWTSFVLPGKFLKLLFVPTICRVLEPVFFIWSIFWQCIGSPSASNFRFFRWTESWVSSCGYIDIILSRYSFFTYRLYPNLISQRTEWWGESDFAKELKLGLPWITEPPKRRKVSGKSGYFFIIIFLGWAGLFPSDAININLIKELWSIRWKWQRKVESLNLWVNKCFYHLDSAKIPSLRGNESI